MIADIYNQSQSGLPTTGVVPPPFIKESPREDAKVIDIRSSEKRIHDILGKVREEQSQRLPSMLAGHIRTAFEAAKTAKQSAGINDLLDQCLRAKKGEYDPEDLQKIRADTPGGSEAFMMITSDKCRACESILKNMELPAGNEKPWGFDPSPVPDLPEATRLEIADQVQKETVVMMYDQGINSVDEQQVQARLDEFRKNTMTESYKRAKQQTEILEKYVEDQLVEGNFYEEFAKVINDISLFPTAFLKGPCVRKTPVIDWVDDGAGYKTMQVKFKMVRQYDRVSPYDAYPSPGAGNINDGPFCQRHRMRLNELQSMIGVDGFDDDTIKAVLAEYGAGGLREWLSGDTTRAMAEGRPLEYTDPDPRVDAIEYWGSVQGRALIDWGMSSDKIRDPELSYNVTAWLIGSYVIMARINKHPLGHNPYFAASFSYNNDSVWGESPPMLMKSDQKACNATARALFNRMGFASGPIIEMHMDRLAPGENPQSVKPWMLIKTKSDINSPKQAVYLTDINPFSAVFLQVYDFFFKQASETTGIPNYVHGSNRDANKTASGFAMQINNMNAMMRNVVMGIDDNIVKKVIYEHWLHMMLYDEDVPKIGDINIRARASDFIIAQEQLQLRRNEALQATNNPTDIDIIGKRGRAKMLRENFRSLKYDENIVPTDDEMVEQEGKDAQYQQLIQQLQAEIDNLKAGGEGIKKGAVMASDGGQTGNEPGRLMANG